MSGFVSTAPAIAGTIAGDGWWPPVDTDVAREALRLDGTVTAPRLRAALVAGILATTKDLAGWRATQEAAGYATLDAVPSPQVDGTSRYVTLYLRAVYCTAHADVIEHYRNFDTVETTTQRAEGQQKSDMADDQRRNARWAIRDILGLAHATVELI